MTKKINPNTLSARDARPLRSRVNEWMGTALVIATVLSMFEAMPVFAHPGPEEHRPIYELDRVVEAIERSQERVRHRLEEEELAESTAERKDSAARVKDIDSRVAALEAQAANTPSRVVVKESSEGADFMDYALGAIGGGVVGWLLANFGSTILRLLRGLFGCGQRGTPRQQGGSNRPAGETRSVAESEDESRKPDEPEPRRRVVTHVRKHNDDRIMEVGTPGEHWSPRTVEQVHEDIANGIAYFSVGVSGKESRILPESSGTNRPYLITEADGVEDNNLGSLPELP